MVTTMPSRLELVGLCEKLRGERLLVASDMDLLQQLNADVDSAFEQLARTAWLCREQQLQVSRLITSHPDATPQNACRLARRLLDAEFVEAHKRLGPHAPNVAGVLRSILNDASAAARLLVRADAVTGSDATGQLCNCLYASVYGCCVFSGDEQALLAVLASLVRVQLMPSADPRLLVRRGNCAFTKLYRLLSEGVFSAKVFLTAALHEPIMELLSQDELFLDIDPSKSVYRFPPEERLRRFGVEGSELFQTNLDKYRRVIVGKLSQIAHKFVHGVRKAMAHFPRALAWLIREIYKSLTEADRVPREQICLLCTDLVFTWFICPAIANPEPLGIIADTPITYIARFNLMQVGQVLQTLAVMPWEKVDQKLMDLYGQFDSDCMSGLLDALLTKENDNLADLFSGAGGEGRTVYRTTALITMNELKKLLAFVASMEEGAVDAEMGAEARRLPVHLRSVDAAAAASPQQSPQRRADRSPQRADTSPGDKRNLASRVARGGHRWLKASGSAAAAAEADDGAALEGPPEILVVSLTDARDVVGLMNEERYFTSLDRADRPSKSAGEKRARFVDTESVGTSEANEGCSEEGGSSCSSLDEATAHPEDISTLADNYSDAGLSANVSGRGSPDISGRDTPLSQAHRGGTTSEGGAAAEGDEEETGGAPTNGTEEDDVPSVRSGNQKAARPLPLPVTVQKENREDLEEKFGKFGLPQPSTRERHRDETHSMVSDSWSTDVVASDNEGGGEASQALQAPGGIVPAGALPDVIPGAAPELPRLDLIREEARAAAAGGALEDRSDTWSVDAIASDSETDPVASRAEQDLGDLTDDIAGGELTCGGSELDPGFVEAVVAAMDLTEEELVAELTAGGGYLRPEEPPDCPAAVVPDVPDLRFVDEPPPPPTDEEAAAMAPIIKASLTKDNLRRQSSGSSFYSRSDVDSEFSRDYQLEDGATTAEFAQPPSRGSLGETMAAAAQCRQLKARLSADAVASVAREGGDDDDDEEAGAVPLTERQSLGRLSFALDDAAAAAAAAPPTLVKTASSNGSTNSSETSIEEARRAHYRPTGAIPKPVKRPLPQQPQQSSQNGHRGRSGGGGGSGSGSGKKMNNLFQGIKVVGDNLLRHHRTNLSPFRASRTSDDLANQQRAASGGGEAVAAGLSASNSDNQLADKTSADDILLKYSRPQGVEKAEPTRITVNEDPDETLVEDMEPPTPYYDPENVAACLAFKDAKRKLRLVLSHVTTDSVTSPTIGQSEAIGAENKGNDKGQQTPVVPAEDDLCQFLRLLLAEAINGQQKDLSAQLREVLRCLEIFENKGLKKLIRSLKEEHRRRSGYATYLQQSRLTLLQLRAHLNKLINRVKREQELSNELLVEVLVRLYLEDHDDQLRQFVREFQKKGVQDEKTALVEEYLDTTHALMGTVAPWSSASEEQTALAHRALERSLMAQVYMSALYPNGDADVYRDQVLFNSIRKLAERASPSTRPFNIPPALRGECPWPSAQAEISILNAYKSPRDKLACVVRCCETIENLVRLAVARPLAADDLTPVLVYVLVQANPPALLSNIQYVQGFFGDKMQGQDHYRWTQFYSAVEFIKSIV